MASQQFETVEVADDEWEALMSLDPSPPSSSSSSAPLAPVATSVPSNTIPAPITSLLTPNTTNNILAGAKSQRWTPGASSLSSSTLPTTSHAHSSATTASQTPSSSPTHTTVSSSQMKAVQSPPKLPSASTPPRHQVILLDQEDMIQAMTRQSIGGASGVTIEMSYAGLSRIRVSITAISTSSFSSFAQRRNPFTKEQPSRPLIHLENLPQFLKQAFEGIVRSDNTNRWDLDSNSEPWPIYEEKPTELNSKTGIVSANYIFPLRLLPNLEVSLRRAVEAEMQRQLPLGVHALMARFVPLPDYVKKLMLECARIYRDAQKFVISATALPQEGRPLSKIIPMELQDRELFHSLKPYQLEGVEFALVRQGRLLLADAPGLGKTIQAIAIAVCYQSDWPVLVICPSSLREMWANEFQRWCPDLSFSDISINFTGKKTDLTAKVNIISYELLKSDKIMQKIPTKGLSSSSSSSPFGVVICDECHQLKTYNTARSKAIVPLVQGAKRAVMLSGTPATSRPSELHTQLSCVLPRVFNFFPAFGDRYCDPQPRRGGLPGTDWSGDSNLSELHSLLTESLMIRRKKSEVLGDMPAKRRHQLMLEIPKETRKTLIKIAQEMAQLRERISGASSGAKRKSAKSSSEDVSMLMGRQKQIVLEMFQNAGRAKLPSAIAHLKQCLASNPETKFLVFAHHIDILDGFSHALTELSVEFVRIDGKTSNTSRQPLVDHFQATPSCRVALLSILAAGVGITLTRASTVFFAELFWNPGTLLQAEDRAHRIGQDKEVDVYYMIAKGTYDERLWDVVDSKLSVLSAVLDAQQNNFAVDSVSTRSNQSRFSSSSSSSRASNGQAGLLDSDFNLSDNAEDSFIQYLVQKIEGYEERSEEAKERSEIRRKVRAGQTSLDDDEDLFDDQDDDSSLLNPAQSTSPNSKNSPSTSAYNLLGSAPSATSGSAAPRGVVIGKSSVKKTAKASASKTSPKASASKGAGKAKKATASASPTVTPTAPASRLSFSSSSQPWNATQSTASTIVLDQDDEEEEDWDDFLLQPAFKKQLPSSPPQLQSDTLHSLPKPLPAQSTNLTEYVLPPPAELERRRSEKLSKFAAFVPP